MIVYNVNAVIDLKEAKIIVDEVKKLADLSQPLFGITYASKGSNATEAARNFFATDDFSQKDTKAMAVIFSQLAQRLMVSLYLKFNKPKSPLKVFRNLKKAVTWLESVGANDTKSRHYRDKEAICT
mgnify:CR=1 FL=1